MSATNYLLIIVILLLAIGVVAILLLVSNGRFSKTIYKDEFRVKGQIGKQNLGKTKTEKSYREIAKTRDLAEAKKLESKMNPKVTHSFVVATKDVRDSDE